jgi:hypothetical protein
MRHRTRKSSTHVTLVLLGAAALAGCGNSAQDSAGTRRGQYATREDCLADWGDSKECAEQQIVGSDGTRRNVYVGGGGYGGRTWWGGGTGGTHSGSGTTRGGFGASGSAHGSGAS